MTGFFFWRTLNKEKMQGGFLTPIIKILQTSDGIGLNVPAYSSPHHAAFKVYAAIPRNYNLRPFESIHVPLGFAMALPDGLCAQILSDPILITKKIIVLNAPVLVSPADQSPLSVLLFNASNHAFTLKRGAPLGQILVLPYQQITWEVVPGIITQPSLENEDSSPTLETHLAKSKRPIKSPRHRYDSKENDEN